MDGTAGHYVKGNKPSSERQAPHDLTHLWNLKGADLMQVKNGGYLGLGSRGYTQERDGG